MTRINQDIKASQVRLVDPEGVMLGVFSIKDALDKATEEGLDLVEIVPEAKPPVCKILNYGKLRYQNKKRSKDNKKKQKNVSTKEIKFKLNIASADYETKLRHIKEFIAKGNKVKISLWFKGREILHSEIGMALIQKTLSELAEIVRVESEPKLEGKQIITVVAPL